VGQPFSVKDVVVVWGRRMKKNWIGVVWKAISWKIWAVLGRKGIVEFLRAKLCPCASFHTQVLRMLHNWSHALSGEETYVCWIL